MTAPTNAIASISSLIWRLYSLSDTVASGIGSLWVAPAMFGLDLLAVCCTPSRSPGVRPALCNICMIAPPPGAISILQNMGVIYKKSEWRAKLWRHFALTYAASSSSVHFSAGISRWMESLLASAARALASMFYEPGKKSRSFKEEKEENAYRKWKSQRPRRKWRQLQFILNKTKREVFKSDLFLAYRDDPLKHPAICLEIQVIQLVDREMTCLQ